LAAEAVVGLRCSASASHQPVRAALADPAYHLADLGRSHPVPGETDGAVDERVEHGPASVGLEGDPRHLPLVAQAVGDEAEVGHDTPDVACLG
jgi:hypothetical protein